MEWSSPDGRIKKTVLKTGLFSDKPMENAVCTIEITHIKSQQLPSEYLVNNYPIEITLGDGNTAVDREIDKCLLTMQRDELSSVVLNLEFEISFVIKLIEFVSNGYIHEWNAGQKCKLAQKHKETGVDLFKNNRYQDASHRFSHGLKLMLSIPVPVDENLPAIDNVPLAEIDQIKAKLYNNLASCHFKLKLYESAIELCNKVIEIDSNNVKAFHKRGFSYTALRDFERAKSDLECVLKFDVDNKAAQEKLDYVNQNLLIQEAKYAVMVKKMFEC